jgi:ribosome maturation factor RimP
MEPVIGEAGYDLEELAVSRAGRRHLVRVIVDGDGGMGLDAIAEVSRAISAALDAAEFSGGELFAGEYQLEVSSPGVDRPLTQPRHWRRNVGRLVKVRVADRQLTGRILAADGAGVALDVDGTGHEAAYGVLGPGRVQVEFNRLAELGELGDEDDLTDEDLDEIGDDVETVLAGEVAGDDSTGDVANDHPTDDLADDDEEREDEER